MKEIEKIITELTSINETLYQITGTDSYTQRCRIHDVIEKLKQIDSLSLQSSKGISDEEIREMASEESQQDWNDLGYKKTAFEYFELGAKRIRSKLSENKIDFTNENL